jgi:RNA polymerase-binding transcription factor DksA
MTANLNVHLIEVPVGGNGGLIWSRLHSEREDICEALHKGYQPLYDARPEAPRKSKEGDINTASRHQELMQARLRKIDDALDRLMSGSYGKCSKCGKGIEDEKLELDPALGLCRSCGDHEQAEIGTGPLAGGENQELERPISTFDDSSRACEVDSQAADVALEMLAPFDTIFLQTLHSEYRILLLDPMTGRSLVEGGQYFAEPVEAIVSGSMRHGTTYRLGRICSGLRLEMVVNGRIVITSPIQSIRVVHHGAAESSETISAALK